MESQACRFLYNDLDDNLLISCKQENENVKERFGFGDFIFSLTGRGKIVGVQILNASKVFSEYNLDPKLLNQLKSTNLIIAKKNNSLAIAITFAYKISSKEGRIPIPLMNLK